MKQKTPSSAIIYFLLMRIGYSVTDEQVNAVCIKWIFSYACWRLRDYSDQRGDISLDDRSNFSSDLTIFLLRDFLQREVSQEGNYYVVAEMTVASDCVLCINSARGYVGPTLTIQEKI
jgi:hypothetical protein